MTAVEKVNVQFVEPVAQLMVKFPVRIGVMEGYPGMKGGFFAVWVWDTRISVPS
jgi:hypothetical protein